MTKTRDEATELSAILEGLLMRLALLEGAGVNYLPVERGRSRLAVSVDGPQAPAPSPKTRKRTGTKVVFLKGAEARETGISLAAREELLRKMIKPLGLSGGEVVVMTAPAQDDEGFTEERRSLLMEIEALAPRVVVTLGEEATEALVEGLDEGYETLRGRLVNPFNFKGAATSLMPTHPPSLLLREPQRKGEAWEDLKKVIALLKKG